MALEEVVTIVVQELLPQEMVELLVVVKLPVVVVVVTVVVQEQVMSVLEAEVGVLLFMEVRQLVTSFSSRPVAVVVLQVMVEVPEGELMVKAVQDQEAEEVPQAPAVALG